MPTFRDRAQRFTTGSDAAGYTLEKIFVGFKSIADPSAAGSELTVTLNEESSGSPGTALCTLRNPSIFNRTGGMHSFSTPNMGMDQCPALRASTTYFAVIERANLNMSTIELLTTSTYGGDSNSAEGWSIGNGAHRYVSANTPPWTHSSGSANILIRVQGVPIPPPPRVSGFDLHSDNNNPKGIWGNDDTFWVSQSGTAPKLFAYNRSDGSRDSSKDFTTLNAAGNESPTGICSDGTTMFAVDGTDNKVYAYKMSDTTQDSAKDITLAMANANATGVWCDANTIWVANDALSADNKIFAYQRSDGTHDPTKDMESLYVSSAANSENAQDPSGLWSNGTTMFVTDSEDDKVYAYKLSDESQDSSKNILLDSDNDDARGLWFDGRVLWVVDDADDRVYAYDLPGAQPDNARADGVPGVRTSSSKDAWAATLTVGRHITGNGYISGTSPVTGLLSSQATFTLDGVTYTVVSLYTGAGALVIGLDKYPTREFTLSVAGESYVSAGRRVDLFASSEEYIWRDAGLSWFASNTISVSPQLRFRSEGGRRAEGRCIRDQGQHRRRRQHVFPLPVGPGGRHGRDRARRRDRPDLHPHRRRRGQAPEGPRRLRRRRRQQGIPPQQPPDRPGGHERPGHRRAGHHRRAPRGGNAHRGPVGDNDPEGTDDAEFTYQWIRINGDSEADIPNATRATYRPIDEDAGKTIKVKVSFTDNEGFQEGPFTTEPTATIVDADVLVRNTGQTSSGSARTLANSHPSRAQAFTTGADTEGYELDSIGFLFDNIANISSAGSQLTVTLNEDSSGNPGSALCTLTNPATFSAPGVHTFSAPTTGTTCATLAASTTYFAVIERTTVTVHEIALENSNSGSEDPGSVPGFSIGNNRHQANSTGNWSKTNGQSHQIEVKGASATAPIVSDNRTWVDNRRGYAATGYDNTGAFTIAQGFRTGDTFGIYEVHEIHVDVDPRAARHRQDPGTHRRVHRARRFLGVRHAFRLLEGGQLQAPERDHRRRPHLPTDVRKRCPEGQHQLLPGHRVNQRRLSRRGHRPHDRVRRRRIGRRLDRR